MRLDVVLHLMVLPNVLQMYSNTDLTDVLYTFIFLLHLISGPYLLYLLIARVTSYFQLLIFSPSPNKEPTFFTLP